MGFKALYALWDDRISINKSIGTSLFQLVYGVDVINIVQLGFPVMKFFQDEVEEPNAVQRRINQMIGMN